MQKHKVQYLIQHNVLYQGVTICHSVIASNLEEQVILGEADSGERAEYTVDLRKYNYENDWQAAEDNLDLSTKGILLGTSPVTTDINGDCQNSDFRLLNTMYALVNDQPLNQSHDGRTT